MNGNAISWKRQPDGSYTSEAGKIWRKGTARDPQWSWKCEKYSGSHWSLKGAKKSCSDAYARYLFLTQRFSPKELLNIFIQAHGHYQNHYDIKNRIFYAALEQCSENLTLTVWLSQLLDEWRIQEGGR